LALLSLLTEGPVVEPGGRTPNALGRRGMLEPKSITVVADQACIQAIPERKSIICWVRGYLLGTEIARLQRLRMMIKVMANWIGE